MFHERGPSFLELMQQALSSTDRGYDLLAPKFEYTPFRTPDFVLEEIGDRLLAEGKVERSLDVCCGTGAGLRMLRRVTSERVVGVDRSHGMLAEGRRLLANEPGEVDVEFVQGDALEMPFEAEFDLAVSFGAFGHILEEDEPRFVRAVHRALKPKGRFVFATTYPPKTLSRSNLMARGFNAVMRLRNAVLDPPFHMYYLTFLLPKVRVLLENNGFDVEERELLEPPYDALKLVVATKR
jgi:ubiquinone/menaquinone biosynthesis C-methylase UbiE